LEQNLWPHLTDSLWILRSLGWSLLQQYKHCICYTDNHRWLSVRGTVVERQSLAGELSLSMRSTCSWRVITY